MIKFDRTGPPISTRDLHQLESLAGFPLPSEYFAFLLSRNGGDLLQPIDVCFRDHDNELRCDSIQVLYSKVDDGSYADICESVRRLGDRLPANTLPIGYFGCGSTLLIDAYGRVLYFDKDDEDAMRQRGSLVIAPTFVKFLAMLADADEE